VRREVAAANRPTAEPQSRRTHFVPEGQRLADGPRRSAAPESDVDHRPWNRAALIAPLLALLFPPVGLCVALVATGQIGLGRQRGLAFAVTGIVIAVIEPAVVCLWTIFS
jgi:hypothetical protein